MSGASERYQHLVGLHDREALPARPVEVVGGIAGAAQADLPDLVAGEQAFLDRAPKRRAMRDRLAEHLVVDVGMGVDVDQRHRPVLLAPSTRRMGSAMVWSPPMVSGRQPAASTPS